MKKKDNGAVTANYSVIYLIKLKYCSGLKNVLNKEIPSKIQSIAD